ncbi:MAG: hypothetical protein P8X69_06935 [Maritimibacter sp.]
MSTYTPKSSSVWNTFTYVNFGIAVLMMAGDNKLEDARTERLLAETSTTSV